MHGLGLVGCVGALGVGIGVWGVVLGFGEPVLGLRGGTFGFGRDGLWIMIFGVKGVAGWVCGLVGPVLGVGGLR